MRYRAPILLFVLSVIAILGVQTGWFFRGFSAAELEQLERDWQQVEDWANLPAVEPQLDERLAELLLEKEGLEWPEDLLSQPDEPLISRAELGSELTDVLDQFEAILAEGELGGLPADGPVFAIMQLGMLELKMDDMDAQRMGHFLAWTRSLQSEGSLMGLMVGTSLATSALERCQLDSTLIPVALDAPAPRVDEFFFGMCRDYVWTYRLFSSGTYDSKMIPGDASEEFTTRAMRRAMANNARRYYPLRTDPQGFGEQVRVERPGSVEVWMASTFGNADSVTNYMESYFSLIAGQTRWLTFVETWSDVLGA